MNSDVKEAETETPATQAARSRVRHRVRKSTNVRERRKKLWTYGLLTVSATLMVNALIGEKGYLANMQARRDFQAASNALVQIEAENASLKAQIDRLRSDPRALEDFAREKLGLIKPGETLIIIRDRPTDRK